MFAFGLSACGGGGASNSAVAPPSAFLPPPTSPPAPSPPPANSGVQFTIDDTISASREIAPEGGQVALDVPGAAAFSLSIPRGAFFEPNSTITMRSVVDTQGLPPGLSPIAAVSLSPAGANFAVQPTIEIDLRDMPRPVGNVVVYLANDDGTGLTYLLPTAEDPVANVLSDGPYAALVPHFSGVGIAISDPNGPGVPEIDAPIGAERSARQALNRAIELEARQVQQGQSLGAATIDVEPALAEWHDDLLARAERIDVNTPLDDVTMMAKEALRLEETRRSLSVTDQALLLEGTELGLLIVRRLALQIDTLNARCIAGNSGASEEVDLRIDFVRNLASAELVGEETLEYIESLDSCRPQLLPM